MSAILDTHLGHKKWKELRAESEELRNSIRSLEVREHEIEQDLPQKEQAVIRARDKAQELESQLSEIRQQLNEQPQCRQCRPRKDFIQQRASGRADGPNPAERV